MNESVTEADRQVFIRCINESCRKRFPLTEKVVSCVECGDLVAVNYSGREFTPENLKSLWRERRLSDAPIDQSGVWRFRELLPPIDETQIVSLREGNTPVYQSHVAADYAGVDNLRLKHLGLNPTGSFKDYGMTVAMSQAKALGARIVICASTGNTSASVAAYAARAGMKAVVLIPAGQVATGKLAQALDYGAITLQVKRANFDDVMRLARRLSEQPDIYLLNSMNPFRIEGQKTILIELLDQLGWQLPDHIVVPGGNLGNSTALGKALDELRQLGLITRSPKLTIIQAKGASPLYQAVAAGAKTLTPTATPQTLATAIRIGNPVNWRRAMNAIETTGGFCEAVDETEIADAKAAIGRDGIGCEPASAATVAGIRKLREQGKISRAETIVAILTGHQLKDPDYTVSYHSGTLNDVLTGERIEGRLANRPIEIEARLDALLEYLYDEAGRR
jgi:threonine synthase